MIVKCISEFSSVVKFISKSSKERLGTPSLCYNVGTRRLPFHPLVYIGILDFLGTCLKLPEELPRQDRLAALRTLLSNNKGVVEGYRELLTVALDTGYPGVVQSAAMEQLSAMYAAALPSNNQNSSLDTPSNQDSPMDVDSNQDSTTTKMDLELPWAVVSTKVLSSYSQFLGALLTKPMRDYPTLRAR